MPSALRLSPVVRSVLGASVVVLLLATLAPFGSVAAAQPTREPAGPRRTDARRIERADIRPRDRAALADLPSGTRIAYHPETGRVRFLAGSADAPLSTPQASLAARRG